MSVGDFSPTLGSKKFDCFNNRSSQCNRIRINEVEDDANLRHYITLGVEYLSVDFILTGRNVAGSRANARNQTGDKSEAEVSRLLQNVRVRYFITNNDGVTDIPGPEIGSKNRIV